jgi:hypothetical protein
MVDAIGDRVALGLEKQDFLEVLLEEARALRIALEIARRSARCVDEAARTAIADLFVQRHADALLHCGDVERRGVFERAFERAFGAGEKFEEARGEIFVDERAFA